ncbi:MAG: hypothetical protein R3300_11820 [Candidatus Promineifilaceae bacterium]|nr:hypothetical protein [Candidatus Promineifilaceae bacterium]
MNADTIRTIGLILVAVALIGGLLATLALILAAHQLRKIEVPAGAGFAETLHYTPLTVVIAVDLLDLAFDFLAAPIAWVILDKLGLQSLRSVASIEALIPGTQLIPTLTLAWIAVRLFDVHDHRIKPGKNTWS